MTRVDVTNKGAAKSDAPFCGATSSIDLDMRWDAERAAAASAVEYARASAVTEQIVQTCRGKLPVVRRTRQLIALLEEDSHRASSAIDLSHVPLGEVRFFTSPTRPFTPGSPQSSLSDDADCLLMAQWLC
jgi:hypothetical protein